MFCHGILNMHETKYGVNPNETILKTGMIHDFERMCDVHEATEALVRFCIHAVAMYILLYKCIYTYNYTLFMCLWANEEAVKSQRQVHQQNIMLNNSSSILRTRDEEMRHAHNFMYDNNSNDE